MEEAPSPLFISKIKIKEEKSFKKDNFTISIGKCDLNEQLIIKVIYPDEINIAEKLFSFDDFIKIIKPLRVNENIDELYSNLIELFNKNEFSIKEKEEKVEISLYLFNNQGIKESYSIFIEEKAQNDEQIKKNIIKKIIKLENENKLLKNENKKLCEEITDLKKQIEEIKKLLIQNNNTPYCNSNIIKNLQNFQFVFDKIEQTTSKKIKNLELLYRASENKGSGNIFHEKCNGKTPTLTIIHSKNDYIFGGYTEISWSQFDKDDNAFCYSINLKKIYPIMKGKRAIGGSPTSGPIFYGDSYNFIQIGQNAFLNDNKTHSCNKKSNYEGVEKDFEISGGVEYFSVSDYEVFQIKFI